MRKVLVTVVDNRRIVVARVNLQLAVFTLPARNTLACVGPLQVRAYRCWITIRARVGGTVIDVLRAVLSIPTVLADAHV